MVDGGLYRVGVEALARRLERELAKRGVSSGSSASLETPDGLIGLQHTAPSSFESFIYTPLVCLILRGRKTTTVGERRYEVSAGQCIIVSHHLPVVAQISDASAAAPYVALIAELDLTEIRSLYDDLNEPPQPAEEASAYAVDDVDQPLLDVMSRYIDLIGDVDGRAVLLPLVRRELHFRLLRARHGAMLRSLLRRDSHASNISRAIQRLRSNFRNTLEVPELARSVGMSASSFHKHFKEVTATTPLQFQKDLRLTEARRLLLGGEHSVSSAAFDVGYESPTQFSREYSRKFGASPSSHVRRT